MKHLISSSLQEDRAPEASVGPVAIQRGGSSPDRRTGDDILAIFGVMKIHVTHIT
jgi:hypothetical protein